MNYCNYCNITLFFPAFVAEDGSNDEQHQQSKT